MRRHTPLLTLIALWVAIITFATQPVVQAAACIPDLPYRAYIPSLLSEGSSPMGNLFILRPEATTNILVNPSGELATTNYTAMAGSLARSTTQQKRGAYSIAITPTSSTSDGAYYGTVSLTNGQTYTFSVDVLGVLGVPYRIYFGSTAAAVLGTPTTFTGTGAWQRVEVTYTEVSTTTRRLYMTKNSNASTGVFYVDGLQLENLAYSTTYCDGDVKGCTWSLAPHTSTSSRSAQVRSGGRKIDLSTVSAYMISQQGTGMPQVDNQTTPYAVIDGSFLNRQSVKERSFTITLSTSGVGTAGWHANRQALIDLVKPNLVYPQQPFVLLYDGGGREMWISCVYDGGLEMADGKQEIEAIPLRCLATDPYWRVDGNDGALLNNQTSFANANYLIQRNPTTAVWSIIGSSAPNAPIYSLGYDEIRGYIYAYGATSIGGTTVTDGSAKWDGSAWSHMNGAGDAYSYQVAANGDVYAIASIGGASNIGVWNGSSWSRLGGGNFTGGGAAVTAMALNKVNGYVAAFGQFTTAPGAVAAAGAALWNGSAWVPFGTGLAGGTASGPFGAAWSKDGTEVYVTGYFTTAGGITVNKVARYNIVNGIGWSAMGTGISTGTVGNHVVVGLDGAVYLSGTFTAVGGIAAVNIAKWNGSTWSALGDGLNGITDITINPLTGELLALRASASGTFAFIDTVSVWNGSSWNSLDIDLPGTVTLGSLLVKPDGTIILGYNTSGTATYGGLTTVVNNGSDLGYPEITITGPTSGTSRIYMIRNLTTNKSVYFNLSLITGETAKLSIIPGNIKFTSNYRGSLMSTVRPGSQLSNLFLVPGTNNIEVQVASSTVVTTMTWVEQCLSIDSSGTT